MCSQAPIERLKINKKVWSQFVCQVGGCGKTQTETKRYDTPHLVDMGYMHTKCIAT